MSTTALPTDSAASSIGNHQQKYGFEQQRKVQPPTTKDVSVDENLYQDSVGQFPFLNGYSHIVYGFRIPAETRRDAVVDALRNALSTITEQIPWLAGQVLQVAGVYQTAPWPTDGPRNEILRIKECDDLLPPMAQIMRASAPFAMLDGNILTPWPSLPAPHGLEPPLPALVMQANFIRAGLLLNMVPHHMAMDGAGLTQVLSMLSTVLGGRDIPPAELEQANRDRRRVVPLIPRGEPVKDYGHLRRPPGYTPALPASPPQWCYFKVPLAGLPALRKVAASGTTLVSDNDILCAFCWQRISVVRLARGVAAETLIKFTRAIDGRTTLGVPSSYMGHLIHHSIVSLPLGQVASSPLSTVAQTLRRALNATNTPWAIRSYATFIAREPDKSQLVFGGLRDINLDLGATSVVSSAGDEAASAVPDTYGLLGPVCFVRRPNVSPLVGTITITPAEGGALPVALCLPEIDLEALKKDVEWRRQTRYVG
ncbi:MAG: hypothetical protein L6R38_002288 [Xanthoria sp. 2 TBL-2021]|nr:MAG: hypothetical protein L6R38_002288 [Xanthoria sp. 2 TBL-2021]